MNQVITFFKKIFDTADWPARWHCGKWSDFHGWLYIISDLMIWSAYFAIPIVIIRYLSKKKNVGFNKLYVLFAAFILACGATHFLDALAFWIPAYGLSALVRFITGSISWATVFYLIKYSSVLFTMRSRSEFEAEIEERKLTEIALKKSKQDYELLLSGVKDYSIFMLDTNGNVASWNSGASNMLGYSTDEIIGKPSAIFYPLEDNATDLAHENMQLALSDGRFETKGWLVRKDKSTFWASIVISPLYDEEGNIYGFAKVTRDITEKRKAEEQILFLASIADNIQDPVITTDNTALVTGWNNAAENLLEWKIEEVIGKSASEILRIVYPESTMEEINAVFLEKKSWSGEVIYHSKSGNPINVLVTVSFILNAEGTKTGNIALVRDITERKRAEEALNKLNIELEQRVLERTEKLAISEKRFRLLIENSSDGIDLSDEFSNNLYRSPGAIKITGILPQENQMSLTHPQDLELIRNIQNEVIQNPGVPVPFQARFKHALGHYVWLEGTITNLLHVEGIHAFITNFRDVTPRKELEMLLQKANTMARIGGWEVDLIKEKVFWSDITKEIHETENTYQPDLATGINFYKEGANREIITKLVSDAIEHGTSWDVELQIVTAKNNERWVRAIGETEFVNGKCVRIYGSFQDIDTRKSAEEKIKNINAELEEKVAQRTELLKKTNEEMEAFSYSVSHDLRAPLRIIIGFANILEEDYASRLDDEAKRLTSVIKKNTIKMGNLVDDLLSFSRLGRQPIAKTLVNSNELVDEVMTETGMKDNPEYSNWIIPNLPMVFADVNTLKQVWINLLSNAVKYSKNTEKQIVEIGVIAGNDETIFFVKDNGVGFDEKYKEKLFKVFQRLHATAEFEGTGVGLAIVEKVISKHGGRVWTEAAVDQGACFYFSLPNK